MQKGYKVGTLVMVHAGVRTKGWSDLNAASPDIEVRAGEIGMIVDFFDCFVQILWEDRTGWFKSYLLNHGYIDRLIIV